MQWAKSVVAKVFGLFVDDGNFAVAVLIWVVLSALVLPHLGAPSWVKGPILFAGLATIFLESATRRARR